METQVVMSHSMPGSSAMILAKLAFLSPLTTRIRLGPYLVDRTRSSWVRMTHINRRDLSRSSQARGQRGMAAKSRKFQRQDMLFLLLFPAALRETLECPAPAWRHRP